MLFGGNITDISQLKGITLLTKYWYNIQRNQSYNDNISDYIFVGDIHGDLNQFLAPLIQHNIIALTGNIKVIDKNIKFYIPEYNINTNQLKTKILFLGDIVDEWIFSRTILYILFDLLHTLPNNVLYIYGNHDCAIIGRYDLYKNNKINIPIDLPNMWNTLKKELNCNKHIKIYKQKILYDNNEQQGITYMNNYIKPIFEILYKIFINQLGKLSCVIKCNDMFYMISHCTWTRKSIKQLIDNNTFNNASRPGDAIESQKDKLNKTYTPNNTSNEYIKQVISHDFNDKYIDYVKLSNACNDIFNGQSKLFISKNLITYSRNTETIFLNQITGHSIGGEFKDINVNTTLSKYNDERIKKLSPTIINNKYIYYFDFGCSAGYDLDEFSRPDYVYCVNSKMYVTNLPAITFIINNNINSLLIMKDKTQRSNNKIIFN